MKKALYLIPVFISLLVGIYLILNSSIHQELPSNTTQNPSVQSASSQKEFTTETVSQHNSRNDCWMIIGNKVYNVTDFIPKHPGGSAILKGCGIDATQLFNNRSGNGTPHSMQARDILQTYYIGDLIQ